MRRKKENDKEKNYDDEWQRTRTRIRKTTEETSMRKFYKIDKEERGLPQQTRRQIECYQEVEKDKEDRQDQEYREGRAPGALLDPLPDLRLVFFPTTLKA